MSKSIVPPINPAFNTLLHILPTLLTNLLLCIPFMNFDIPPKKLCPPLRNFSVLLPDSSAPDPFVDCILPCSISFAFDKESPIFLEFLFPFSAIFLFSSLTFFASIFSAFSSCF